MKIEHREVVEKNPVGKSRKSRKIVLVRVRRLRLLGRRATQWLRTGAKRLGLDVAIFHILHRENRTTENGGKEVKACDDVLLTEP